MLIDPKIGQIDILSFVERFKTDRDCKRYLYKLKWFDGFACKKCGYTGWCSTKDPYLRNCNRCKYKELPTADTLFHKCKFSLRKAFMIVHYMSTTMKGISTYELTQQLDLRQKTCWLFQQKVRQAMCSKRESVLNKQVVIDDFVIGGPEKGKRGAAKGKRRQWLWLLSVMTGIHDCYAHHIEACGTKQLRLFFDDHTCLCLCRS